MSDKRNIAIALPSVGEREYEALRIPIESGWLTQGPQVAAFEKEFSEYQEADHALAVTSATTGLHLALVAMGVGPGDEVIVPSFTWIATANVVEYCGAKPVFADVDLSTFNIDVNHAASLVTERTKAVIPVHLFGMPADMDGLRAALPKHVLILEDAACGAGCVYKGRKVGAIGDAGVFSFHPRKTITTGEGGMVTTNNTELFTRADMLRNHGASISEEQRHHGAQPYILPDFNLLGFNYRMTDFQGAVGRTQLERLEEFIQDRAKWAAWYAAELSEIEWLSLPYEPDGGRHSWQAFVTYVDPEKAPLPRNEIMKRLMERGISTRPGTHAVHLQEYYVGKYSIAPDALPRARDCQNQTMAIPLHNRMNEDDFNYIVAELKSI